MAFFSTVWGIATTFTLAFIAGALIGRNFFEWLRKFFPWNK